MTMRKPEDVSVYRWIVDGLNLKTVLVFAAMLIVAHFSQSQRITVVEQGLPATNAKIDATVLMLQTQAQDLKAKVDKDTYAADQKRLAEQLQAIQESNGRIEQILMQDHKRN